MKLKVNGKWLSLALHALIVNGQFHHFLCTATFHFLFELKKQESSHEVTGITRASGEAQYYRKTQLAFVISVQFIMCSYHCQHTHSCPTMEKLRVLINHTVHCHQIFWMPRGFPLALTQCNNSSCEVEIRLLRFF